MGSIIIVFGLFHFDSIAIRGERVIFPFPIVLLLFSTRIGSFSVMEEKDDEEVYKFNKPMEVIPIKRSHSSPIGGGSNEGPPRQPLDSRGSNINNNSHHIPAATSLKLHQFIEPNIHRLPLEIHHFFEPNVPTVSKIYARSV